MKKIPTKLSELGDLRGKKVLVRADFNVPVKDEKVLDTFRIDKALPTITFLIEAKAKVILMSHIESVNTLRPVYEYLKGKLAISFCEDCLDDCSVLDEMKEGDVVLCENVRLYSGEKTNDPELAKKLAALADVYVNDAFPVSHRSHASVVGVPLLLPGAMGLLFESEFTHLSECLNPEKPFVFILGGAKFDTKVPLIKKFLETADTVVVAGALAHNFYKARGYELGESLVSEGNFNEQELLENSKLVLPQDVVVTNGTDVITKVASELSSHEKIVDAGPQTLEQIRKVTEGARFIVWNGPLGNYENGFKEPTIELARIVAESGARSVVGGGDTLAAIAESGLESKFSFVSTAGGAMLDFLLEGTLPGIEALLKSK